MRSIAGAIIVLAGGICFAAGLLGDALGKESRGNTFTEGLLAALILGVIGLVIVFAGMLEKRE